MQANGPPLGMFFPLPYGRPYMPARSAEQSLHVIKNT